MKNISEMCNNHIGMVYKAMVYSSDLLHFHFRLFIQLF